MSGNLSYAPRIYIAKYLQVVKISTKCVPFHKMSYNTVKYSQNIIRFLVWIDQFQSHDSVNTHLWCN